MTTDNGVFQVTRQGDRKKVPDQVSVRRFTREEVMALGYGSHPAVILNNGRLGTCKVNGQVRTWKTQPDRIEVPIKYGMYEFATFSLAEAMDRFVVEIEQS